MNFEKVGTYDGSGEGAGTFTNSIAKGNYVYAIDEEGGLSIIDKTDPTNPTLTSFTESLFEGLVLVAGLAISADGNTLYSGAIDDESAIAYFCTIDVTDKSNPDAIDSINLSVPTGDDVFYVASNQAILLLSSVTVLAKVFDQDTGQSIIYAVDVTDPSDMAICSNPITADGACTNVFERMDVQNLNLVVLESFPADFTCSLRVYDMSDRNDPHLLGTSELVENAALQEEFNALSYTNDGPTNPAFAVVPTVAGGEEFVSWDILVWDTSNPTVSIPLLSRFVTSIPIDEEAHLVKQSAFSNDILAVVDQVNSSTRLFDVSDPSDISEIQEDSQAGCSVCFDYPYFFTTDPVEADTLYAWLITTTVDTGWSYGNNNVIYQ